MRVELANSFHVRGDLCITARCARTGQALQRIQIRNLIVNAGLGLLPQLLAQVTGGDVSGWRIKYLHAGEGATPPVPEDLALEDTNPVELVLADDTTNKMARTTPPCELRILVTLDDTHGNDKTLREAGLVTENGTLFARQIHAPLTKTAAILVDYDWRIAFTA
jgi:hypothetical protein